jgi:hypothetical protein
MTQTHCVCMRGRTAILILPDRQVGSTSHEAEGFKKFLSARDLEHWKSEDP